MQIQKAPDYFEQQNWDFRQAATKTMVAKLVKIIQDGLKWEASRYCIDLDLLNRGYDAVIIEVAWQELTIIDTSFQLRKFLSKAINSILGFFLSVLILVLSPIKNFALLIKDFVSWRWDDDKSATQNYLGLARSWIRIVYLIILVAMLVILVLMLWDTTALDTMQNKNAPKYIRGCLS